VETSSGTRLIRTTGRVEADEDRVYRLTAGTDGWGQSLESNPAGAIVQKNQLPATLYRWEFRNTGQACLGTLASLERGKTLPNRTTQTRNGRLPRNSACLGCGTQITELVRRIRLRVM